MLITQFQAHHLLTRNEVIGVPTETVYGLAGNAFSETAVAKIFEAKNRPTFDPLIVHVASQEMLSEVVSHVPEEYLELMQHFWPGPLTLLFQKSTKIPDLVTSGLPKVAVRWPAHPEFQALLQSLPFPLAAPSANPFGYISPTSAQHVMDQLGDKIGGVLEGGECEVGVESTIVDVENGEFKVLRLGGIAVEDIERVIGKKTAVQTSSSQPAAPGMLDQHYAPKTKLWWGDIQEGLKLFEGKKIAVLSFMASEGDYFNQPLSARGSLTEAAAHLFKYMRQLDGQGWEVIIAEPLPNIGLGRAINDRLLRASIK